MEQLTKKPLFNENGDIEVVKRRMIGGNTTNLNDFNNLKYAWVSNWYRQAMNNFWIPEEINLNQDVKDYRKALTTPERRAYDKVLSFLVFLDSIQTANLPNIGAYITANEVNLCLNIQTFQEAVHSQSYGYMLDTICSPEERTEILYQWKFDEHLLARNKFIGDVYNQFLVDQSPKALLKVMIANYILEGIYFYSGFMFFYNLGRNGKMPGSVQEIRREHAPLALPLHHHGTQKGRTRALYGRDGGRTERDDARGSAAGNQMGTVHHRKRHPRLK